MNCPANIPKRSEKTRGEIMSAFTQLVFAKGFENVSVLDVVASANVARSTFYEHFAGKEDVLRACMEQFFAVIADCVLGPAEPGELRKVLDHLWQNRRLADAIFSGQARAVLARNQIDLIETRLRQLADGRALAIPLRLAATALAEAQLSMIETWLRGHVHCSVDELGDGLHRTSRASALALIAADARR